MADFADIEKKVKKELNSERYRHTLGVTYTAACLAMRYSYDVQKARLAGLLHDCAKCISNKKKISMCEKAKLGVTDFEKEHPFLLHAKLGAYLAKEVYDVEDETILSAIFWHTTGKPDMSMLDKIIYIADYIEPNRDKAPRLGEIRELAFVDLDQCLYEIMKDTVNYLELNPKAIDKTTMEAYEYYRKELGKEDDE